MRYHFIADWKDRAVREVGRLMAPRVIGLAAAQINFYFVAIFFASRLESGAISAVNFAWLIVMTPLGVIGMAISTAAFPTLAEQAARGDRAFATTLAGALRLILFLSIPICLALVILARPIVTVLLQRGAFDVDSTELTAQALTFYALAVPAHSGIEIVSRGFYATGDTKTPVAVAVASMVLNLVLATALVGPLDVQGLGLALSVAATAEFVVLLILLAKKVPGMTQGTGLWTALTRLTIAAALSIAAFAVVRLILENAGLKVEIWADAVLIAAAAGGAGGLVYLIATLVLGLREPLMIARRLPLVSWLVPASWSSD
jgi:putative peptidoglycan lipid II flippase